MQYEITDRAAIEFARTFYESLTEGLSIDTSTAEARKAVSIAVNNTLEWGTPGVVYALTGRYTIHPLPATQSKKKAVQNTAGNEAGKGKISSLSCCRNGQATNQRPGETHSKERTATRNKIKTSYQETGSR
jgi:hypothetical protein